LRLTHRSVSITDRSSIGEARRVAMQAAQSLGFNESRRSDIGIVATEAASNVLSHASSGELLVCPFVDGDTARLDVLALDSGPGIREIGRAMEDGFSTGGTQGQGLGAIRRLSDEFGLYSPPEKGTVCWSRFRTLSVLEAPDFGLINVPVQGETLCGDGFLVLSGVSRSVYMVVDGLGHGAGAAEAADEAILTVRQHAARPLAEIMTRCHDALRKTRGAAMSIAAVDHQRRQLSFIGIGNVAAMLITGGVSKGLTAQNGTLGLMLPREPQEYTYPIERSTSLLMFSDGLSTKVGIGGFPGLQNRHPAILAAVLYRDFTRKRDDATILCAPIGKDAA
jgi:anti-sigma regulatory factor (Ser/Thr protein kinase)